MTSVVIQFAARNENKTAALTRKMIVLEKYHRIRIYN
jgi:hypothetical protein